MKYCQGPSCHTYRTKDRIRGPKGAKVYQTRRRSSMIYDDNFCSQTCANDWFEKFGERAVDHFGRLTEPKRTDCDNAWYKSSSYNGYDNTPRYNRFFVNDLINQRVPITEEQYNDDNLVRP